ncbi:flagellar hook protein FlgE [Helicovermis profundi]|uniref:Flagellar hook protein FlgE n=1 Tax=Helicovermis profundi TaxID=3065157 RepID=A0AAU9EDD8_9FIRM|nr:flagellar hook protein FlgE [Clostridia bacterium S502]
MMRSLFSGVSGLRAHQVRMDVIGNNIANVNTVGFKSSNVQFSEVFSQTVKGAGSPQGGKGGTNPQQIGLGMAVGSINVNHSKGSTQRTDNATDLMVDGNGFFVLSNDANGQNKFYTRAGNFSVDKDGYLVAPNGFKVLDTDQKSVQINQSETKAATASSDMILKGNLNFNDTDYTTTFDVYDSLGDTHSVTVKFEGAPLSSSGKLPMRPSDPRFVDSDANGVDDTGRTSNYSFRKVSFSDGTTTVPDPTAAAPNNELYAMFNENGDVCDFVTLSTPAAITAATVTEGISGNLVLGISGAADITIPIDKSIFYENGDLTKNRVFSQYSQTTDLKAQPTDGNSAGSINSFSISSTGEIVAVFTNGERKTLSTIGLANFDNPTGLMKVGSNLFLDSPNSGTPKFGSPSAGGYGAITPGALEMSNVDLAAEFTNMITTQRGFQANSKIITTSDEMLQELVNLKR